MFGLIRFGFFVFVAALTGLLAVSIPFEGKTVAQRVGDWWSTPAVQRAVREAEDRVKRGVEAAAQPSKAAPREVHDSKSRAEVDRLVASRSRSK